MAQTHKESPFAVREEIQQNIQYALPESAAYATPRTTAQNDGWIDSPIGSYSVRLDEDVDSTPDPMRLRHMAQRQFYPDAKEAPEEYYAKRDADDRKRHSVETQDADGFTERVTGSGNPVTDHPDRHPADVARPTAHMSPRTYTFTRPAWGGPLRLNGEHFSMADHRRTYDILGTQPVRSWRNTYRVDPAPWDTDVIDMPGNLEPDYPNGRIISVEVPFNDTRSFRLA